MKNLQLISSLLILIFLNSAFGHTVEKKYSSNPIIEPICNNKSLANFKTLSSGFSCHNLKNIDNAYIVSNQQELIDAKGIVLNIENGLAIPNAEITFLKNNRNILSNQNGEFEISLSKDFIDDKIVISAMGFINDTISIEELAKAPKKIHEIWLQTQSFNQINLDGVTVTASNINLTAEEIIQKARKNVSFNYTQNPYNQKFFYNYIKSIDSDSVYGLKAIVETFNSKGMKKSFRTSKNLYGEIEQFKTIGKKQNLKDNETNFVEMTEMFNWDLLLSKSNVLYRTKSYSLTKVGVIDYNNKEVYKIRFVEKSPNNLASYRGHSAIKESSGLIYIDKGNYAVLRYEHCIKKEPSELNNYPGKIVEQNQKILFSCKQKADKSHYIRHGQVIEEIILTSKNDDAIKNQIITKQEILSIHYKPSNITKIKQPLSSISVLENSKRSSNFWRRNPFILQEKKLIFGTCM
ncbi:hypothetical protein [uncultured Maribacter sp.]|uniref:hypothetical protein n=1 Tax=uncultured Maribacter sp. TaxID=431308 RepID=UPI00260CE888|nr:hypothetical protein [uncultured Maribacter sp.]